MLGLHKIHDLMMQKAISMNKGANDFTIAAQEHADATWIYIIIAAIIWYFFGWKWALIPIIISIYYVLKSISATLIASKIDKLKFGNDYTYIVQSYGKILEELATIPRVAIDIAKLPHTKQQIKEALVFALQNENNTKMREHLKSGYVALATWQANVGKEDITDIDTKIISQNTQSLAQQILAKYDSINSWIKIVQEEEKLLVQELEKLGIWK